MQQKHVEDNIIRLGVLYIALLLFLIIAKLSSFRLCRSRGTTRRSCILTIRQNKKKVIFACVVFVLCHYFIEVPPAVKVHLDRITNVVLVPLGLAEISPAGDNTTNLSYGNQFDPAATAIQNQMPVPVAEPIAEPPVKQIPQQPPINQEGQQPPKQDDPLLFDANADITIVTGYLTLGDTHKDIPQTSYYRNSMEIFRFVNQPVIAFVETDQDLLRFQQIRSGALKDKTIVSKVPRESLHSFQLYPAISKLFSDPNYPKFIPDTVVPEYACITYTKYEFIWRALRENPFKTKYFAWLDMGCYRHLNATQVMNPFKIHLPSGFMDNKVSYSIVNEKTTDSLGIRDVFYKNIQWVSTSMFIAEKAIMEQHAQEFFQYLQYFVKNGLAGTAPKVLYAMYTEAMNPKPKTLIQAHTPSGRHSPWQDLCYSCKEQWESANGQPNAALFVKDAL